MVKTDSKKILLQPIKVLLFLSNRKTKLYCKKTKILNIVMMQKGGT